MMEVVVGKEDVYTIERVENNYKYVKLLLYFSKTPALYVLNTKN